MSQTANHTPESFKAQIAALTEQLVGRALDSQLDIWLNNHHGASGTAGTKTVMVALAELLADIGSKVVDAAVPTTVTVLQDVGVNRTVQVMDAPTASGLGAGIGKQATVAPGGNPATLQVGSAAGLGPLLVQVTVPLTVVPAAAVAGKPVTVACMSACGSTVIGAGLTLLPVFGSAVVLPAVVVIVSGPVAGAGKVLLQVIVAPTAIGLGAGLGMHDCVAPGGRPLSTQVAAAAGLGPALVQVPLTVTG